MSKLTELVRVHLQNRHRPAYSSQVSWRGVTYDPSARSKQVCETKNVIETYRGVKHEEKVRICK